MPLYFHLLDEEDLIDARPVLELLGSRREEVLARWYERYVVHFGAERTFSEREFTDLMGPSLDKEMESLVVRDMLEFSRTVRRLGERLVERRVPFAEIVVWTHLFEESCQEVLRSHLATLVRGGLRVLMTLDKLSHCRMVVLSEAYFRAHSAGLEVRAGELEGEVDRLAPEGRRAHFHGLVGESAAMLELQSRIRDAAPGRGTALVVGDTGTGKELVARALWEVGDPEGSPFIPVNCAALPSELIESELFGHRRGAFSGASGEYIGLVRAAHGGTLFLDEVTEMHPGTQAKLLRVVQERAVRPVGFTEEMPVDVRLVASTNRDPLEAIRAGQLREDLYYRLKVHTLRVPPLCERLEDLPLLCAHFLALLNSRYRRRVQGISDEAIATLAAHDWPGNVRELMGVLESAFARGRTDEIRRQDLPLDELGAAGGGEASEGQEDDVAARLADGEVLTFEQSEKALLGRALAAADGNKSHAARMLGISRKQFYAKLRKFGLEE